MNENTVLDKEQENDFAGLTPDLLRQALLRMHLIRSFEEKAEESYTLGKIHGTMHLSIGQEASAVGSCLALRPDDYILSTHRGHGHSIAKGADLFLMMAEFFGKETGYCRGRGGSMHIADVDGGNLGANGVVGGGIPISIGVGLSIKMQRNDRVCLTFFGDGAANEGAFHEALNMSSIYQLPVIYVCENNQYAMSMPVVKAIAVKEISKRAAGYGIPGVTVDGNDLIAVYKAVREAVSHARSGGGPTLIENVTYRWRGHSKSDRQRYRTREEVNDWQQRDPIVRLSERLLAAGVFGQKELDTVAAEAHQMIEDSVAFAEAAPEPNPDNLLDGVYA